MFMDLFTSFHLGYLFILSWSCLSSSLSSLLLFISPLLFSSLSSCLFSCLAASLDLLFSSLLLSLLFHLHMSLFSSFIFSCLFSSLLFHLLLSSLVSPLSSSRFFSFIVSYSLFFSCLVLSLFLCLSLSLSVSVFLLSLCFCLSLSLSFSVSVWCRGVVWCVVSCCLVCRVVVCGVWCVGVWCCVVLCGVVWCCVWRGLARRKNLRVQIQNVPLCTSTTRTCVTTCARGAGTHGDILNLPTEVFWTDTRGRGGCERRGDGRGGHRQFCSPKFARRVITCFREVHRKKPLGSYPFKVWEQVENTFQSFALPDEPVEGHCGRNQHAQHTRTHQHIPTHPPTHRPTHHHSLPSLSHTHTQTQTQTYMHVYRYMHVYLCMCVIGYVDVYVHVYVYVFVFVCVCVYVYDLPQWFHVCATSLIDIKIIIFYVIVNRGSHNIRNGIAWAQTGHGTFTWAHQKFESFKKKSGSTKFEFESAN